MREPVYPPPTPGEVHVDTPDGCLYTRGDTTYSPLLDGKGRPNNGSTGDWDIGAPKSGRGDCPTSRNPND
jgi:hypothetical protein